MSNHPFGLRGDPFASPATLSAKDSSRLIRRRVRAFNGDGGALFPIETCDLIHELAGGVPDRMLELAGSALRLAASENASTVSLAHVRAAWDTFATPDEPPVPRMAADEPPVLRTTPVKSVAIQTHTETCLDAVGDDIPPMPMAGFMLPSRPSENLDRDERDWVLRFIPPAGPAPAAERFPRNPSATPRRETPAPVSAAAPVPVVEDPSDLVQVAPSPSRRSPQRVARRRKSNGRGLVYAFAVVCIVGFVVRLSLRGDLRLPWPDAALSVTASAPAIAPSTEALRPTAPPSASPVSAPADPDGIGPTTAGEPVPTLAQGPVAAPAIVPPAPESPAPAPTASPAAPTRTTLPGRNPGVVEPAKREPTTARFGLEVATFIFEERARAERDRLAAAGLRARVMSTTEHGTRVYRVVVGGYPHPAAAERAADSLLGDGVVTQARVVTVPSGR